MWVIQHDHLARDFAGLDSRVGKYDNEPSLPNEGEEVAFLLFDDDGELYYSGWLNDDPDCANQSAALKWAAADAGCTTIKVLRDGKWVQEIG